MVNKLIKEDTKMFLTGNEVLAYAANSAEADFMYGYPITPQNEIMHTWCKLLPKTGAGFLQTEDEISAEREIERLIVKKQGNFYKYYD